jgi:hypothetical protein
MQKPGKHGKVQYDHYVYLCTLQLGQEMQRPIK